MPLQQKHLFSAIAATLWLPGLNVESADAQTIEPAADTGTTVTADGDRFDISGGSVSGDGINLFHSFEQFGLSANEIAHFLSQPDIQNILARVVGGNPSLIDGLIQVTGGNANLYLMNPAGIVFGTNASLNVPGDFFATTATGIGFEGGIFNAFGSNDYLALAGIPSTFEFDLASPAPLVNGADLTVNPGRNIGLIGGNVINTGTLSAPGGNILISAVPGTNRLKLSQPDRLLALEIEVPVDENGQPLPITPLDLPALLVGAEERGIATGLAINADGNILLESRAIAPPEVGTALVAGTLDAAGADRGGNIYVLGDRIGLLNTRIDASGVNGGGNIWIGGNYQGKGDLPTAERVFVNENTEILADALTLGDGGRVIVWSDRATNFSGNISARGGAIAGDGGFVEVSGKENLHFAGFADTSAPFGEAGTLLLDPSTINIIAGATPDPANASDGLWAFWEDGGTQDIGVDAILGLLGSNSVTLQATWKIIWDSNAHLDYDGIGSDRSLTLQARHIIDFAGKIYDSNGTGDRLNVNFQADADGNNSGHLAISGPIDTGGGNVTLQGGNDSNNQYAVHITNNITSNGGNITVTGNDIATNGTAGVEITSNLDSGGGDITLTGTSARNDGVKLGGTLTSGGGNITVVGENRDTAENQVNDQGVDIDGAIASGGGNISITGTSGLIGVDVNTNGSVNSGGGAIDITGIATGTDADRKGIYARNTINSGTGDIILTSDRPTLNSTISGTGILSLKPQTAGQTLTLGGTGNIDTTFLNALEIANLSDGFSSIQVGDSALASMVELLDPGAFQDPLAIQNASTLLGPNIDTNWTLTGNNQGSISGYANPISFSDVTTIRGGSGRDTFAFGSGVNFNGFVDGGAGTDTLDYSGYGSPVTVDLTGGTATGTTGIANIEESILPSFPSATIPSTTPSITPSPTPIAPETTADATPSLPAISGIETTNETQPIWSSWNPEQGGTETIDWVDRQRIISSLDTGDLQSAIALLDKYYSQNFLRYLGKENNASVRSFQELHDALKRMTAQTGTSTAVLYAFTRDRHLDLILVPPTSDPIHYTVDVSRQDLLAVIQSFQHKLSHPLHRRNTQYLSPSQQLYQWLIAPTQQDLQRFGIEGIAFVLDDGLRTLPMAALHDGKQFLVENYAVSLVPSFHLIPHHYTDIRNGSAIAMGMSEFTEKEALPAVPVEVATISETFPTRETFLNEPFTLDTVRNQPDRAGANIVHLATHGQFQPGTPEESYIQLWDRKLSLAEMGNLDWQDIELLVLSACRTAFGDESAEYGFAGLSIQAGVSSAVASLWYASDTGTLALMNEFYQQLRSRGTKAEALRQAQIAMISGSVRLEKAGEKANSQLIGTVGEVNLPSELGNIGDRNFQHPYYWSGFTLIGSPW
ncbi:MAG: CHAT domain-containing protein [Cyanobacteria bacterium P01_E01_bin.42]